MESLTSSNPGDVAADVRAAARELITDYRCSGCGDRVRFDRGAGVGKLKHWLRVGVLCGLFIEVERAPTELREHWRDADCTAGRG